MKEETKRRTDDSQKHREWDSQQTHTEGITVRAHRTHSKHTEERTQNDSQQADTGTYTGHTFTHTIPKKDLLIRTLKPYRNIDRSGIK